jgi:hypothetical protein
MIENVAIDDDDLCILNLVRRDAISGDVLVREVVDCMPKKQVWDRYKGALYNHYNFPIHIPREEAILRRATKYVGIVSDWDRGIAFGDCGVSVICYSRPLSV